MNLERKNGLKRAVGGKCMSEILLISSYLKFFKIMGIKNMIEENRKLLNNLILILEEHKEEPKKETDKEQPNICDPQDTMGCDACQ